MSDAAKETVFSKIIRGEIPCHKVYEDELVLAFLDIAPLCEGHTLVIPKEEAATLDRLSERSAEAIGRVLPKIARAVMQQTGAQAFNVLQNNGERAHQFVFHVHFHIIPKFEDGAGLGVEWSPGRLDPARAEALADALRQRLDSVS